MDIGKGKRINGVDVGILGESVETLKKDAELAKFMFRVTNKWMDGGHNRTTVGRYYGLKQENSHEREFVLDADEPAILAGTDLGANPVEHLLNSLAGCMTTAMVYHAAIRGIVIEELESEIEGDIDLRGFLGITNEVRKGYQNIRVKFRVRTDAGNIDKLKALCKMSPTYDVISKGTNVEVSVERMAVRKAA